jgi:hypothetical protein
LAWPGFSRVIARHRSTIASWIAVAVGSSLQACEEAPVEDTRFDAMAKALGSRNTRRLTLGALLSGALGALGVTGAEAAKSGKCKRQPGECERCDKGKCERKHGKKTCKAGKITPKANGTVCSGGTCQRASCIGPTGLVVGPVGGGGGGGGGTGGCPVCQALQGTTCVNAPAGTACNGTGKCTGSGTCTPAPNCIPRGSICAITDPTRCCSGDCVTRGTAGCAKSQVGEPCITDDDCNEGFTFLAQCGNNFSCEPLVIIINP